MNDDRSNIGRYSFGTRTGSHNKSMLSDHLVFCPKYRGKVLSGEVGVAADDIIRKICSELEIKIIQIAVNPDHVHLFYMYPPNLSVCYIANIIKGKSSRLLRQRFPHLKKWCKHALWAPSCFHGSVGHGWNVVENYIRGHEGYRVDPSKIDELRKKINN